MGRVVRRRLWRRWALIELVGEQEMHAGYVAIVLKEIAAVVRIAGESENRVVEAFSEDIKVKVETMSERQDGLESPLPPVKKGLRGAAIG